MQNVYLITLVYFIVISNKTIFNQQYFSSQVYYLLYDGVFNKSTN